MSDETNMTDNQARPQTSDQSKPVLEVIDKIITAQISNKPENETVLNAMWEDFAKRTELGIRKYGQALHTFNGRNARLDLYMEILDAIQYQLQITGEADPNQIESLFSEYQNLVRLFNIAVSNKQYLIDQGVEI